MGKRRQPRRRDRLDGGDWKKLRVAREDCIVFDGVNPVTGWLKFVPLWVWLKKRATQR